MKIIKRCFVLLAFLFFKQTFCQETNIFILDSSNKVDSNLVKSTYTSVGFNPVNIVESSITSSLDTSEFDIAYVAEGYYYSFTQGWVLDPIQETERQIIQNFIEQGGHVVWISENGESGQTSESPFTTINNIYGTIVSNGTFFNNAGYGSPSMHRIHPSNGPGGLSLTETIYSSGSYATMVDVPNCNKVYTSESIDYSSDMFYTCTHTTLAVFPGRPKPNEGSVIISTEIGSPMKPWTIWGGITPTTIYNTELDSAIASLHYKLLVEENTDTINDWTDIESNMNPDCPTVSASYTFGETELCVGDTIVFTHADGQSVPYTNQDTGTYRLSVYYEQGTCRDDTIVYVSFTDAYVDAGIDTSVCEDDEVILEAENPSNALISWDNNVIDGLPFVPTSTKTYVVISNKFNCSNSDTVKISVLEKPLMTINVKEDTSLCFGNDITLNASTNSNLTVIWTNGIDNNVPFTPTETNNYIATTSNNGCDAVDSITIEVKPSPTLSINDDISLCEGELFLLNAESTGTVIWNDTFENNHNITALENDYYVARASIDDCFVVDSFYLSTFPIPEPNFNIHYLDFFDNSQTIFFENLSDENNFFTWILENGNESYDYSVEQSFKSNSDTILTITLIEENSNNCVDSIHKNIKISSNISETIYLPTAFTPNDNSLNDGLKPIFNFTIFDYNFSMYNRWGELIFETNDIDTYWDGTLKGEKVPDGLYTYRVRYNRKIKIGTVHVIK